MTALLNVALTVAAVALAAVIELLLYSSVAQRDEARRQAVDEHNRAVMWNPVTGAITHEARDEEAA